MFPNRYVLYQKLSRILLYLGQFVLIVLGTAVLTGTLLWGLATERGVQAASPPDDCDSNNTSSGADGADLKIIKTVNNPTPSEGDQIVYTIIVTNLGPNDATWVRLTDVLPTGVTYAGDNPSQGNYNSGNGRWTVGNLNKCANATLTIRATVDSGTAGMTITNTSSYLSAEPSDPNPNNNVGRAVIRIEGVPTGADLAITKTVNITNPSPGDIITYTVIVTNNGPDDATGVQISDTLPISLTFSKYITTQGIYSSNSGLWVVDNLSNTGRATLTIVAKVKDDAVGQVISNTVNILITEQIDPISSNNTSSAVINISLVKSMYLPIILKDHLPSPICTIYHKDDFNDPNSGWITGSYLEANYSYFPSPLPERYEIYPKAYKNIRSTAPPLFGSFSQYTIKVKARWANMSLGDEYGIIFGIKGKDNQRVIKAKSLYRFVIDTENNRHFALRGFNVNVDPTRWYSIVDWTKNNDAINKDTEINILEVRCYESAVALIVNDHFLWGDSVNCSGEIGITLYPDPINTNTNVYFDDFEVCGLPVLGVNADDNAVVVPHDSEFHPKD